MPGGLAELRTRREPGNGSRSLGINSAPLPRAARRGGRRGWHGAKEETVTATGLGAAGTMRQELGRGKGRWQLPGTRGRDVQVSSSLAMWIRARFLVLPSIFSSRSKHIFSWFSAAACSSASFTFSA